MREIRFRGKSKNKKVWLYGYLFQYGNSAPANVLCICVSVPDWKDAFDLYQVEEDTIGQFTGLRDKDGKEIYEGDVVECVSYNELISVNGKTYEPLRRYMRVVFANGAFRLKESFSDSLMGDNLWEMIPGNDIVVIGNVHDNPELEEQKSFLKRQWEGQ